MNEQLEELGLVIKGVVQSSKDGVLMRRLQEEYRSLNGHPINYEALGFSTLESLLRAIPNFVILDRSGGELRVRAVTDANTAHLSNLIQKTRVSKSKRASKPNRRLSAQNQGWRPPQHSRGRPNHAPIISHSSGRSNNYQPSRYQPAPRFVSQNNYKPRLSSVVVVPVKKTEASYPIRNGIPNSHAATTSNRYDTGNSNRNDAPNSNFVSNPENGARPKFETNNFVVSRQLPQQPAADTHTSAISFRPRKSSCTVTNEVQQSIFKKLYENPIPTAPEVIIPISPLDIIKRAITPEGGISPEYPITPVTKKPETYKEMVDTYASQRGEQAIYKRLLEPKKKKQPNTYLCTLSLIGRTYNSYPEEKATPEEADEEAARRAVEQLGITDETMYIPLPEVPCRSLVEIELMKNKIFEIVIIKTNGIFHRNVQQVFEKKHKMTLPTHWIEILRDCSSIKIERSGNTDPPKYILFPRIGTESPCNVSSKSLSSEFRSNSLEGSEEETIPSFPNFTISPEGPCDIFVTCVKSSVDIVINLVEYSEAKEELSNAMNVHYGNNLHAVTEVIEGEIYAFFSEDNWHRVQVHRTLTAGKVTCLFVDHGDFEDISTENLQEIQPQFLELQFQAIGCEMSGLEYFSADEGTTSKLQDLILGKTFVAQAIKKDDTTSLIIYDTSTSQDEDININEQVLEYIYKKSLVQSLPTMNSVGNAHLTNANAKGEVTLKMEGPGNEILLNLLEDLSSQLECQKVKRVSFDKTYAAKYSDGLWYRVRVLKDSVQNGRVSIRYIDFGLTSNIQIEALCELNDISEFLVRLPVQCVSCRLNQVPFQTDKQWSERTASHLMKAASSNQPLLIKVTKEANPNSLALVELFKRTDSNELISINNTIAMNETLFDPKPILIEPVCAENIQTDIAPKELILPYIPKVDEEFDVLVCYAAHPNNFIIQPYKTNEKLEAMVHEMNLFYSDKENIIDMDPCLLHVGRHYAVKHTDGSWYRAYLKNIISSDLIIVFLVDYGEYTQLGLDHMQQLYNQFRELRCQAIKASLHGVQPKSRDWATSDVEYFKSLVLEKPFVSQVKAILLSEEKEMGKCQIELALIDTSSEQDINISHKLIETGIARPKI